jgi:hypothetical protein
MATDYSSIYTIKEFYQKILPLYFDDKELALSTVGALGMFVDVNASTTEDMMNVTGRYITEIMPGQSELPDFIYSQAANYGVTNVLATPAKMSMLLLVKEKNVVEYATMVDEHLEFTLDADMNILVDDLNFSLPFNVKIRSTLFNGEYNHMAYYDKDYSNEIVNEDIPFIKTMKTDINGDVWLVLRVNVYQYKRIKEQVPITTNSILNIPYADLSFSDQLCNFEVFYTPAGSNMMTQLEKRSIGQQPTTNPFVYYKLSDDNTIRLSFANDDRYWVPGYNSTITVYLYETAGTNGNFPFSQEGVDVYVSAATDDENLSYNRNIFPMGLSQGNSTGGTDQLTLEKVKALTTEKMITVNSYTTDNDLNVYFNNFASIYNHDAVFVKQRDDYAGREYGCFTRINDGRDIVPTNTLNIRLSTEDMDSHISSLRQYILKPGTVFIYESEETHEVVVKKDKEDLTEHELEYALAPLMVIKTKPNKVNYYMNTVDKNVEVDYTYFNLDSVFNFVVKECHIRRDAIRGEGKYHIELQLARVDGVFNDLQSSDFKLQSNNGDIDTSKMEVLIVFDTTTGDYFRMTCETTGTEEGEYIYTFSADIETTDTIDDGRILLTGLTKREDDGTDERLVDMTHPGLQFAVFYDYGEDDNNDFNDISVVAHHTLCNIYTPQDGELYLAYPMDLMRSHVIFEEDPDSNTGYGFYVKQVPLFGKDFLFNSDATDDILNDLTTEHTFLTNLVSSLHGLFTINMKFYNTYGKARNFYIGCGTEDQIINHVNCTVSIGIKFFDGIIIEDYMDLIKAYIKNFFENLNKLTSGTNQAFISVLEHKLHAQFEDQIKYAIFYSINGYDSKYQIIENLLDMDDASNPDYVPEYLTLTTDNISIIAL